MGKILGLSILFFGGTLSGLPQVSPRTPGHGPGEIGLCELIRSPEVYDGKVVTVSAALGSGPEGSILYGETCNSTISKPDVIANVVFSKEYDFGTTLHKKLRTLSKKSGEAQVTVVGLFLDGKSRTFGHMSCCRYQIEIRRLLEVDRVKGSTRDRPKL